MLKFYVQTREAAIRLRNDERGVVSFEYIIVAACVVAGVSLAFGTGNFGSQLQAAIATIVGKVTSAATNPPA